MLRSNSNPGAPENTISHPTLYRTGPNRYRLLCSKCGELCYVDEPTFQRASRVIMTGGDNPFFCHACEEKPEVWLFAE